MTQICDRLPVLSPASPGARSMLNATRSDFDLMARVLDHLGENWRDRPSYVDAAKLAGLSPHHFHRVFSRWAGLSPKRYVDSLAHDAARGALDAGASVLEATFEAELSSPSRLHDLFIAHEATTPGQARRKGEGMAFVWGAAATPFGLGVFLISPRGLSALAFADSDEALDLSEKEAIRRAWADLCARYPAAQYRRDDEEAAAWAQRVFLSDEPTPLALFGTPWQRQVWRALLTLSPGETGTYKDIAAAVNAPKAARAVGAAVGANPVSYLIPCHRVLASDGRLTGYHWGVPRKRAMLAFELARRDDGAAA